MVLMFNNDPKRFTSLVTRWQFWLCIVRGILALSLVLAWVSSGFQDVRGWLSFLRVTAVGVAGLLGVIWMLRNESIPRWVYLLLLGAVLLRVAVGAFLFISLPVSGHGSPAELAGYYMALATSGLMITVTSAITIFFFGSHGLARYKEGRND